MNTYYEHSNDIEDEEDIAKMPMFDQVHNKSIELNVKNARCTNTALMTEKRAKHCLTMMEDCKCSYNKLILAIGGVTIKYRRDPYLKKTTQSVHDLASVEFYSLQGRTWDRFNSRLNIARHSASASYIGDYVYVMGGHTVDQPKKFINTFERCHKLVPSSVFERITLKQRE